MTKGKKLVTKIGGEMDHGVHRRIEGDQNLTHAKRKWYLHVVLEQAHELD